MGYAVPAAMGAKVADPDACVWAIDGDGCFQMTNQELATCAVEGIPVKIAIINNGNLGMVRQWQTLFYNERYSNTDLDRAAAHVRRSAQPRTATTAAGSGAGGGTASPTSSSSPRPTGAWGCAARTRRAWTR